MAEIWLISDTHINHSNILTFKDRDGSLIRPFPSLKEMHSRIIEGWNSVVKDEDKVYHLGDVTMDRGNHIYPTKGIIDALKGHKRLILGNHDHFKVEQYLQMGFEKIFGCRQINGVMMTHIPIHPSNMGRFKGNVHGHIHQNPSPPGPYLNVSVEALDYVPINYEDAKIILKSRKEASGWKSEW